MIRFLEKRDIPDVLHKKSGFKIVGLRKGIARKNDQWINTILMEQHLILE